MCDILTAASAFLTVSKAVGANQAAQNSMNAAAETQAITNAQIQEEERQINQRSALEQSERNKMGMLERAEIKAIAGESGAIGFNTDRLVGDSYMQEGIDIGSLEMNRSNAIKQAEMKKTQAGVKANNAFISAEASSMSLLDTGLQIGAGIYSAKKASSKSTKQKTGT